MSFQFMFTCSSLNAILLLSVFTYLFLHISRTSVDGDCTSSLALAILRTVDCNKFSSKVIYFSNNLLNFWVDLLDQWGKHGSNYLLLSS